MTNKKSIFKEMQEPSLNNTITKSILFYLDHSIPQERYFIANTSMMLKKD
jgi:hypothetical protein